MIHLSRRCWLCFVIICEKISSKSLLFFLDSSWSTERSFKKTTCSSVYKWHGLHTDQPSWFHSSDLLQKNPTLRRRSTVHYLMHCFQSLKEGCAKMVPLGISPERGMRSIIAFSPPPRWPDRVCWRRANISVANASGSATKRHICNFMSSATLQAKVHSRSSAVVQAKRKELEISKEA